MGIDLYCSDKTFGCSYGTWFNVRNTLIEATFEYIVVHLGITKYDADIEELGAMSALKLYIEKIKNGVILKDNVLGKESNLIDQFIIYSRQLEFVDLLIQFGIGGIYTLCNKSDCEGFYSVGNSYDICDLLKVVKPFLLKNKDNINDQENWLYGCIDEVINVFKESVEKKLIVKIC
jgi:hypothetical protein